MLENEVGQKKEEILLLKDKDAALSLAGELSGKLVVQEEVLHKAKKEFQEKQEQLQQTAAELDGFCRQENRQFLFLLLASFRFFLTFCFLFPGKCFLFQEQLQQTAAELDGFCRQENILCEEETKRKAERSVSCFQASVFCSRSSANCFTFSLSFARRKQRERLNLSICRM